MTTPVADVIDVVHFTPPPLNPTPHGLFAAIGTWQTDPDNRWHHGVQFRSTGNYGGDQAFGIWNAPWCGAPDPANQKKEGERPDDLDPFYPLVVWAYDECDLTAPSRAEVEARAAQVLRLEEQVAVEREFAARLLLDAAELPGGIPAPQSFTWAIGQIEAAFARTNTTGFIHIGAQWATSLAQSQLMIKSGSGFVSPLGHRWVVGGGYVGTLGNTVIGTSQPYGWRDEATVRTAIDEKHNIFAAVAERSVLIGYEALVAAQVIA